MVQTIMDVVLISSTMRRQTTMTTLKKTRTSVSMLACAAMMAGGLALPTDARADVATATVLGGVALLNTLLHASQPEPVAVAAPAPVPAMAAAPMPMAMPMMVEQPAIYTSVAPMVAPIQQIPIYQPVPVPVAQPYPVPVPVAQPYAVPVPVAQPYAVPVPVPVVQPVSYQVTTRVIQPVSYQVTTQIAQPVMPACLPAATVVCR